MLSRARCSSHSIRHCRERAVRAPAADPRPRRRRPAMARNDPSAEKKPFLIRLSLDRGWNLIALPAVHHGRAEPVARSRRILGAATCDRGGAQRRRSGPSRGAGFSAHSPGVRPGPAPPFYPTAFGRSKRDFSECLPRRRTLEPARAHAAAASSDGPIESSRMCPDEDCRLRGGPRALRRPSCPFLPFRLYRNPAVFAQEAVPPSANRVQPVVARRRIAALPTQPRETEWRSVVQA